MIVPLSVAFFPEESDDQDVVVHYRLTCDHDDCQAEAIPCFISPDFEVEEKDHYCPAHAPIHGFCAGCGIFVGVFENSPCLGYCPDCAEEKLAEELSIPSLPALKIMPLFISLPVDGPKLEDVDIDW